MCITLMYVQALISSKAFVVVVPPPALGQQATNPLSQPDSRRESWHQSRRPYRSLEIVESIRQCLLPRYALGDDDIDLDGAITNARKNLAEGKSPGAGLESAYDQADAAFADLIMTSVDDQGVSLDAEVSQSFTQN